MKIESVLRKTWLAGMVGAVSFCIQIQTPAVVAAVDTAAVESAFAGDRFFRAELYFGMGKKDGSEVTPDEWSKFLADEVTTRFPDGFTVVDAAGQFRSASGVIVREKSRMLILLYKKKDRETAGKKIDEIRAAYCKKFEQESVLRLDFRKSVEISFEE